MFDPSVGFIDDAEIEVKNKEKNVKPQINSTKVVQTQSTKVTKPLVTKSKVEISKPVDNQINKKSSVTLNTISNVNSNTKPTTIKPKPVESDDDADIITSEDESSTDEEPTQEDLDFIDDDDEYDAEHVQGIYSIYNLLILEFLNRFKAAYRPNRVTDL